MLLFTRTSSPHAQSRRLRLLSRCFAAKIAYEGGGYVVPQHLRTKIIFLQASLTNLILILRFRVNSSWMTFISIFFPGKRFVSGGNICYDRGQAKDKE